MPLQKHAVQIATWLHQKKVNGVHELKQPVVSDAWLGAKCDNDANEWKWR